MAKSKKRDSPDWRERLEREHPAICARLLDGTIHSVRAACAEARLIHLPTRLDALMHEWKKASASERKAFLDWLKASHPPRPPMTPPASLVDSDGRLTGNTIEPIEKTKTAPNFRKPGQVMATLRGPKTRRQPRSGEAEESSPVIRSIDRPPNGLGRIETANAADFPGGRLSRVSGRP